MAQQQSSSADLAKQFGGTDVSSLAAQFGGTPVDDAPTQTAAPVTPTTPEKPPQTFGHFVSEATGMLNPFPLIKRLTDPSGASDAEVFALQAAHAPVGLGNVVRDVVSQQKGEWQKAKEAYDSGHYGNAIMYALSSAVPIAGPTITGIGEKAEEGDYVGAAGQVAGLAVGAKLPKIASKMALPAVEAVQRIRATGKPVAGTAATTVDLIKAIQPLKTSPYTPGDVQRAAPYLASEHAQSPITSVQGLRDAADSAITQIEEHIGQYVAAHPKDLIRTKPLDAAKSALATGVRSTDMAAGLKELSDLGLDGPLTLSDADAIRLRLNAENRAVLKKNNYDQATARKVDPTFAAREAAAKSLRDGIYQQLEERGIKDVANLRRDEGALIALRNSAEHYGFVGERPVSGTGANTVTAKAMRVGLPAAGAAMGASVGGPFVGAPLGGAAGIALARKLAPANLTRDALVARAFEKLRVDPAEFPAVPDQPPIAGLLEAPQTARPMPSHMPDASYVRSVPAVAQPFNPPKMLPSHQGRPMPPKPDTSGGGAVPARGYVVRDPKTGRFKRVYSTEGTK